MTQKVAFIGLGNMGGFMAANLVKGGYDVQAFDLSTEALDTAVEKGCSRASDPEACIDGADFIITMLPNGQIVESLMIDRDALMDRVSKETLIIDCSTVSPDNSRRLGAEAEKRGLHFIDAPVSGGVGAAEAGTLAFMCGGAVEDVERARPVLGAMGANVFRAGDHGAGAVAKICNNMLLAVHMTGTAEALQLGVNNGLDPKALSEIMLKSSGSNWSLEKYNPYPGVMEKVPASNDYQGGFLVDLMLKDLGIALETAHKSGSAVPMGSLAQSLYSVLKHRAEDSGKRDFSSILKLFE